MIADRLPQQVSSDSDNTNHSFPRAYVGLNTLGAIQVGSAAERRSSIPCDKSDSARAPAATSEGNVKCEVR